MKRAILLWVGAVTCGVAFTVDSIGQSTDAARAFAAQSRNESIIDSLRSGYFGAVTPKQLSEARPDRLIPLLEELFAENRDPEIRERIASTLGGLGVHEDLYWNFLVECAKPAIESDAPLLAGCEGQECSTDQTASFRAWAQSHNIAPDSPQAIAISGNWQHVTLLAASLDTRAIPLLRRALHSPNESVASEAARGLAQMHDTDSIPLMVAICRQGRPLQARVIANALQLFGTPEADRAAEEFLPKPPDPVKELQKGAEFPGYFMEQAAEQHRADAIPALEAMFASSEDELLKDHVASALVRLGDKDSRYWEFLIGEARVAVSRGTPSATQYDTAGKVLPGVSEVFADWTKAHGKTLEEAESDLRDDWSRVAFLALTGDPRGAVLLRQALSLPETMLEDAAADGLAKIQDRDSIPLLIEACERAPADARLGLAEALASFDSPDALKTAQKYLPEAVFEEIRNRHAANTKPVPSGGSD
jgi:HEAT repeat protein